MRRQPPETQTLYAELSERLRASEATRSFSNLSGSFTKKHIKGADYWYFKTSEGANGQREYFVGPDSSATTGVMQAYAAARPEAKASSSQNDRLCSMLRHGGALLTDTASARVVSGLASAGVFRAGAVLVGTHAFIALGNVLGVRWESIMRTQDIDLAASAVLHIAIPDSDVDLPKALDALQMGFLPVPGLNAAEPATSFKVRGHSLRVDLLTPAHGPRTDKPVLISRLNAAAQPLELLGYVLDATISTPLLNGGATLVNVPDPARFALHKLIVSGRRQAYEQVKAGKDRQQAGELIAILHEERRGDLLLAVDELNKLPAVWRTRLRRELIKLSVSTKDASDLITDALDA